MFEARGDVMPMFEQFRSVDRADLGTSNDLGIPRYEQGTGEPRVTGHERPGRGHHQHGRPRVSY